MSYNSQVVINHIKKRKQDLVSVLGGKCCICGFDQFVEALDFHHVNPKEKSFGIGASNCTTRALDVQLQEVRKCVLVCANCHRGIHAGYIEIPKDYQLLFNEEIAAKLLSENYDRRFGKKHLCQRCGVELKTNSTYCVDCAKLVQRKVDRPSREELKTLIRTIPFVQIAKQYNVTDNAIRKWCIAYKLPSKKKEIITYTDDEWLSI